MTDITKIAELRTKEEGGDFEDWPYPTLTITSRVTGELRQRILAKLGRPGESGEVTLTEIEVSGGWSEFTQEQACSIEVQVDGSRSWVHESDFSTDSAMAAFMKWLGE